MSKSKKHQETDPAKLKLYARLDERRRRALRKRRRAKSHQ